MICCLWLAAERGRTYDSLSALSFAALGLLGNNPYLIFHSGFQLSFAAVLAISGPGQWMIREYNIGKNWEKTVVISLWVQIFLLPVMAWHYYQYPLYGMLFEFSGIAAGAGFDDSGNHDIAYRRIFAFGSRDSC